MKTGLTLEHFFIAMGAFLAVVAVRLAMNQGHPKRWGSAAFWLLLAVTTGAGNKLPNELTGWMVLAMGVLAATGQVASPIFKTDVKAQAARAAKLGNRLLVPILLVPAVAIVGGYFIGSQLALGVGCLLGMAVALVLTKDSPKAAASEGGRLLELLGWALILPQALAALGGIFAKAGVGEEVAKIVSISLPVGNPLVAVVAYCGGMVLFTVMMGNAFAAFPIMTLGVGLPFIVKAHGGDPAIMGVFGMTSGYCGTLLTPMAANFNIVPARLLELRNDYAVIQAQAPFAALIWIFNVTVMALCVYPK
ncbi:DUF979 domain-containing protein [Luteolibacter pohnpeiensis]|uniref:DUF979 domain-containing protein n=1 Tax=Luteolibacter pohnpeiensis TaxID=454153 RepID=A0A934VYE8_9BACT|nr:DUF979 domain-containing protein [Luteolibacter pohnpeiensis]MBK1884449.1 DUF979 domain-containing protein [Luteolibacter pohnpeiensis]